MAGISYVFTITRVAQMLGEDADWLQDICDEMDPEDGRLTVLGTDGYLEVRKNVDIAGRPGESHLFLVDQKQTRYIDCTDVELPFGPSGQGAP